MEQLTIGNILAFVKKLQNEGMTMRDIKKIPIYLGDDDELNGIHTAWYTNLIDPDDPECEYFISLIDDGNNTAVDSKAILIS